MFALTRPAVPINCAADCNCNTLYMYGSRPGKSAMPDAGAEKKTWQGPKLSPRDGVHMVFKKSLILADFARPSKIY